MLITATEAAEILGMQLQSVYDAASRGRIPRHAPSHVRGAYDHEEIEALSLSRLNRIHHQPHPYGATTEEAAVEVHVSRSNVPLMMLSDRLPYETAAPRTPGLLHLASDRGQLCRLMSVA
ncbi:MAG: hypothetical protein ACRDO2_06635 [Nocardioidaceae bacterium]